jgi:hypothetical protein
MPLSELNQISVWSATPNFRNPARSVPIERSMAVISANRCRIFGSGTSSYSATSFGRPTKGPCGEPYQITTKNGFFMESTPGKPQGIRANDLRRSRMADAALPAVGPASGLSAGVSRLARSVSQNADFLPPAREIFPDSFGLSVSMIHPLAYHLAVGLRDDRLTDLEQDLERQGPGGISEW